MKLFSPKNQTFGLGQISFGPFRVFLADLLAPMHFGTVSPLSMFSINQPLLSLYIQIPNIYLGLGFEFGPQRSRDLAIVCP